MGQLVLVESNQVWENDRIAMRGQKTSNSLVFIPKIGWAIPLPESSGVII